MLKTVVRQESAGEAEERLTVTKNRSRLCVPGKQAFFWFLITHFKDFLSSRSYLPFGVSVGSVRRAGRSVKQNIEQIKKLEH